jgi:hypothetical protein
MTEELENLDMITTCTFNAELKEGEWIIHPNFSLWLSLKKQ